MHRYEELEKKYYIKKAKKTALYLLFAVSAAAGVFYIALQGKNKNETVKPVTHGTVTKKNTVIKTHKTDKTPDKKQKAAGVDKKKDKKVKAPKHSSVKKTSQNILSKLYNSRKKHTDRIYFSVPRIKKVQKSVKTSRKNDNGSIKKTDKVTTQVNKNNVKNILKVSTIKESTININELVSEFEKKPDFETAMTLSNYFYAKKNYSLAKQWAIKANNLNPMDYRSWKMFALILIKKNDKIKAKKVLQTYLNEYGDNDEIYKLLRSINE